MRLQTKTKCFVSLSISRTPSLLTPSTDRKDQNKYSDVKAISRAPASVIAGGGGRLGEGAH